MLLWLLTYLVKIDSSFAVLNYITLRTMFSTLTALFVTLFLGNLFIGLLKKLQLNQVIRVEVPQSHWQKKDTPTMGGLLIAVSIVASCLLWADLSIRNIWLLVVALLLFTLIGVRDDLYKIRRQDANGMRAKVKFLLQSVVAFAVVVFMYYSAEFTAETELIFPIFKDITLDLGWGFIVLGYLVIVASANSVNMTDGLDGLVLIPCVLIMSALTVFVYVTGNIVMAEYLQLPYIASMGEVAIFCGAFIGACLGFLWYNTYPAQIFMGDTGSMLLGGSLGLVAILVRQEIVYFVMSGIFVAETLSVILQVGSYKLFKKRIFLMAPLHHHFELKGIPEPKVIVRFWIVTLVLVAIGLMTLKIR